MAEQPRSSRLSDNICVFCQAEKCDYKPCCQWAEPRETLTGKKLKYIERLEKEYQHPPRLNRVPILKNKASHP